MSNLNLWELASQKAKEGPKKIGLEEGDENATPESFREDSYLLLFGSKDSGKTSLLLRFLEREESPKPTIALEYTFARRSRGEAKEVGHLWELGGGPFLTNLIDVPIALHYLQDTSLLLMLDLSKPEELWHTAEALLAAAKLRVTRLVGELKTARPAPFEAIIKASQARIPHDHQDRELLKPFPIPLAIVGSKYDLFQDMDSEKKKLICKTLRFLAHTNGASLTFYSSRMEGLVSRGRALLSQLVFATPGSRGLAVDHAKPLFVPPGADSFRDIGAPPAAATSASNPFEMWKAAFCEAFPQKNTTMEIRDDPAKDPAYKEEAIDVLRALKDQELERLIVAKAREAEQEKKLAMPIPRPSAAPLPKKAAKPPPTPSPEPTPPPTPQPRKPTTPLSQRQPSVDSGRGGEDAPLSNRSTKGSLEEPDSPKSSARTRRDSPPRPETDDEEEARVYESEGD